MRRRGIRQRVQIVATFQDRDDAPLPVRPRGMGIRDAQQFPGQPSIVVGFHAQFRKRIGTVRIEPGGDDNQFRGEFFQRRQDDTRPGGADGAAWGR